MDLLYSCCIILGTNPELIIYTLFDSEFAAFADQMDSVLDMTSQNRLLATSLM